MGEFGGDGLPDRDAALPRDHRDERRVGRGPMALVDGRAVFGRHVGGVEIRDAPRADLAVLPQALERAEAVLGQYGKTENPRLRATASFRGLNNASDELILGLKGLADKYGTLLQTHACFSYSTHDSSLARCGMAEIERLEHLGVIDERMLIVHSGWLEPEEVAILAKRKAARQLGVPEHAVVKTLVMQDEKAEPLIVLMHGDKQVSTKNLARAIASRRFLA